MSLESHLGYSVLKAAEIFSEAGFSNMHFLQVSERILQKQATGHMPVTPLQGMLKKDHLTFNPTSVFRDSARPCLQGKRSTEDIAQCDNLRFSPQAAEKKSAKSHKE